MPIQPAAPDGAFDDALGLALLRGTGETAAALCLCDADDRIRYANPAFVTAFLHGYDGRPTDFIEAIMAAMTSGTGIRVVSTAPADFADLARGKRLAMSGSRSFTTDMVDGSWWSVTDTKLSNGWILAIAQDISALKNEEARLRDAHDSAMVEAQTDFLTGVPNRRHGLRRAEALWQGARAAALPLSVALMDIDHFKTINDLHGHEAGDHALVHFARAVTAAIGPQDVFARIGGDEFMLLRPETEQDDLDAALGAMLAALAPVTLDQLCEPLRLSISVGVAEGRPNESWPALMHRADMALYAAKAGGRNRIALAA